MTSKLKGKGTSYSSNPQNYFASGAAKDSKNMHHIERIVCIHFGPSK